MPFCKRTIVPKNVCKADTKRQRVIFTDLADVCGFAMCSLLRQLSDLSRQSVSILEDLEGELASVCLRSRTLESKVISLQKHISTLATKPPPLSTTNLDSESKRTGHFQSSWQQHVNVLGSWSRPECVQDLHGDAQLNLQRLLQEFGEHLYDPAAVGQTLTKPCSLGLEEQSQSQVHHLSGSSPDHPRLGPPVPAKPRWLLRPVDPIHLVRTGDGGLIQEASHPSFLTPSSESASRCLPLRNTHDDLAQREPQPHRSGLEMMENMTLMCSSWNGPRGSTFCPTWDDTFSPYLLDPSPVVMANPHLTHRASEGPSVSSGSLSSSFTSLSMETSARTHSGVVVDSGEGRSLHANGIQYRQCPLSTPADSNSFHPAGHVCEGHTLSYHSSGSEDRGRPAMPRLSPPDGQMRERSRSISLKKLKKKPLPPLRSVSLGKSLAGKTHAKVCIRPKSLCLPRDLHSSQPPDIILSARQCPKLPDVPLSRVGTAAASGSSLPSQSQSRETHRSQSSSSTATGTTTIELANTHGSFESLPSPSPSSSCQNYTQLSPQSKMLPLKPPRLMSPSSGYSSLSDTPTPTVPTSLVMGPSPLGCRMRPKVPERKSSLTPTSERERAARARLSCELPLTSRLDPPSVRPKPKASRRHSDSSATVAMMLPQKLSSGQAVMPLVTETDLQSVHLRSVGHNEMEAGPEGSSHIIQEEHDQDQNRSPVRTPNPKPKPPIPTKPLLPKRPLSLMLNSAHSPESPLTSPATPTNRSLSLGNISQMLRKPKSKKGTAPAPPSPAWALEGTQQPHVSDHLQEAEHSDLPSEIFNNSRKLPSRITISCLAELDRKQIKVPPPVPRKPGIHFLPVSGIHMDQPGEPSSAQAHQDSSVRIERVPGVDLEVKAPVTCAEAGVELSQQGTEEDYDDVFVRNSTPHTAEDLFTIIHRSKRKVLGRKEPLDSFGSRQSLVSPVKAGEPRSGVPTRNDTFMAMLQKRNGRPGPSARLSATELLQSTNPLARRVTDGVLPDSESVSCPKPHQQH